MSTSLKCPVCSEKFTRRLHAGCPKCRTRLYHMGELMYPSAELLDEGRDVWGYVWDHKVGAWRKLSDAHGDRIEVENYNDLPIVVFEKGRIRLSPLLSFEGRMYPKKEHIL